MSLLLFALFSTALAIPAPCPPHPPSDCGIGFVNCPGPIDPMGCRTVDLCTVDGEDCPFHCPMIPTPDCGEGSHVCPGPIDPRGCSTVDLCAVDGEDCPVHCDPMGCSTVEVTVPNVPNPGSIGGTFEITIVQSWSQETDYARVTQVNNFDWNLVLKI